MTGLATMPASALGTDTEAAEIGASWLQDKLIDDLLVDGDPGKFESIDASIDASLAFAQVPGYEPQAEETVDAIDPLTPNYISTLSQAGDGANIGTNRYAGRIGKMASFAYRNGRDLDAFGGGGLVDLLSEHVATSTPIEGRVKNAPEDLNPDDGIDFVAGAQDANVIDQAWVVEALQRASEGLEIDDPLAVRAEAATAFLFKQQCSAGYFREEFTADISDTEEFAQWCIKNPERLDSEYNNRTTAQVALILLALVEDGIAGTQIQTELPKAVAWLIGKQNPNGSLREQAGVPADAYTTGLAGLVFAATNHPTEARLAAEWLRELQAFDPDECIPNSLTFDTGAIAPNKAEYNLGKTHGIGTIFLWKQSTALTLPLLTLAPQTAGPPAISGPTGFVHSGAKIDLRISRLEMGERACVYGLKLTRLIAAEATTVLARLVAPAGTANRRYTVKSIEGNTSHVLRILDTKKLTVKAKRQSVKRKSKQQVVVSGLAAGENVRVMIKGKVVAKGKANASGKFKKKFKVKAPRGQTVMKVWGYFNDRNGKTKFKVR